MEETYATCTASAHIVRRARLESRITHEYGCFDIVRRNRPRARDSLIRVPASAKSVVEDLSSLLQQCKHCLLSAVKPFKTYLRVSHQHQLAARTFLRKSADLADDCRRTLSRRGRVRNATAAGLASAGRVDDGFCRCSGMGVQDGVDDCAC